MVAALRLSNRVARYVGLMAPDPAQAALPSLLAGPPAPVREKVRVRFRKGGDLRLVSHHDLMRTFERMLRRAALPFHSSEGFHPKARFVFALSLPLGIVGCEEVVELELDEAVAPEEVKARLSARTCRAWRSCRSGGWNRAGPPRSGA